MPCPKPYYTIKHTNHSFPFAHIYYPTLCFLRQSQCHRTNQPLLPVLSYLTSTFLFLPQPFFPPFNICTHFVFISLNSFSPLSNLSLILMAPLMGGCFWLWWRLKQQQQQQHQQHRNMATDYGIQPCFVFHSTNILVRQKGFSELQFLPVTMLCFLFS